MKEFFLKDMFYRWSMFCSFLIKLLPPGFYPGTWRFFMRVKQSDEPSPAVRTLARLESVTSAWCRILEISRTSSTGPRLCTQRVLLERRGVGTRQYWTRENTLSGFSLSMPFRSLSSTTTMQPRTSACSFLISSLAASRVPATHIQNWVIHGV